jgi:ATP-binding cassette subfamily B protein/subfamily B ATP-binding cassette protein MsbA
VVTRRLWQMLEKMRYRFKVLSKLNPFAMGVKRFFFLNIILSIIASAIGFATPLFYKMFIEQVILQDDINKFIFVVIGYLGIYIINLIIGYIKYYSNNRLINRITFRVKLHMWKKLINQEFTAYEHQSVGDIKMRLEDDTNIIIDYAGYQTIDYIIAYVTLIILMIILFILQWHLAVFSISVIPLTFWLDHKLSTGQKILNNEQRESDQNMVTWLHTSLQGWREVKALNLEFHEKNTFLKFVKKYALYYSKWINYWTLRALILPKIRDEFFMQFGLYFIGGLLIIFKGFRIGDLLVFAMYYSMLSNAIKTVSTTDADLQSKRPISDRLLQSIEEIKPLCLNKVITLNNIDSIEFDDVCFAYPASKKEVLSNFSLNIKKGEHIAVIGKSGAGKSTILKLMTGMLTPSSGEIRYSGTDLALLNLKGLHKKIGFVMQDNMLFNDTIKENLLYAKSDATYEELVDACKKAYIYEMINSLPHGFNTIIGEQGIKLSGGQRQRIVLARLFLQDVEVFIFDEATSALDKFSENLVYDAIKNISAEKTIIVVTHRKVSMDLCDRKIEL